MPLDGAGKYRHNDQVARMHGGGMSRDAKKDEILGDHPGAEPEDGSGEHTEVHNHGDGTFHTVHGGEQVEHESIGHMHAHLSKIHGAEGEKHFHSHSDGIEHSSHAVESGGEPEHMEHNSAEEAKEALGNFFDEEAQEPEHKGGGYEEEPESSALGV